MPEDEVRTEWDGFADYQSVAQRNARTIHDAVEAFATVERAHQERGKLTADVAAKAGSRILTAAINVQTELAAYEDQNDDYEALLAKFQGETGYVERLRGTNLRSECPPWLYDFVVDIRRAGFELGYLKAGRESNERELKSAEDEAREMFADL